MALLPGSSTPPAAKRARHGAAGEGGAVAGRPPQQRVAEPAPDDAWECIQLLGAGRDEPCAPGPGPRAARRAFLSRRRPCARTRSPCRGAEAGTAAEQARAAARRRPCGYVNRFTGLECAACGAPRWSGPGGQLRARLAAVLQTAEPGTTSTRQARPGRGLGDPPPCRQRALRGGAVQPQGREAQLCWGGPRRLGLQQAVRRRRAGAAAAGGRRRRAAAAGGVVGARRARRA
jgi:hypothetical protein